MAGKKSRPKRMKSIEANYPGWCSLCDLTVAKGDSISRWGSHWNHTECCEKQLKLDREQARSIRSHKTNTWHRGKSPSSYG
jgi:hypothetical protein